MSTPLSQEHFEKYLEERLQATSNTILTEVRQGFAAHDDKFTKIDIRLGVIDTHLADIDSRLTEHNARFVDILSHLTDHDARFQRIETTLATLVESVDRFAKIYTDLNQEVVVMRQQLRDVEDRVGKLELKLKAV
jgi:chromosome segregation ATPase